MDQLKCTKIIATLGPATDKGNVLEEMLLAGVDVVRLNFSHGERKAHAERINKVRACAEKIQREIGVFADLQGPKIRIGRFKKGRVFLEKDDQFILDANMAQNAGEDNYVGIVYKELPQDVKVDDILLLDDGRLTLKVNEINGPQIVCTVVEGGELSDNKGINLLGGGLSTAALTDKDREDLKAAVELGVDYIAVSFPRDAKDIQEVRALLDKANSNAGIIAKIERNEALDALDEIIEASDAVMVARGDLGVEIGEEELPAVQKDIIRRARKLDKVVITATQMMESMIHRKIPTRAEVLDVANAVLDGTDAVMLSAETAVGDHPVKVIEAMKRICLGAEKHPNQSVAKRKKVSEIKRVDEGIAMAAMFIANNLPIKAIIALTESGNTAIWMSRVITRIPIYALSRSINTCRRMTLVRAVHTVNFDVMDRDPVNVNRDAVAELEKRGLLQKGDWVIITKGDRMGVHGGSNAMKIVEVGKVS